MANQTSGPTSIDDATITPIDSSDFRQTMQWRVFRIMAEFIEGFQFLNDYDRTVTIFGSARFTEENKYYQVARTLGEKLSDAGFGVVTGGGPGIMEAGNRGAHEAKAEEKGPSISYNIQLPFEVRQNDYVEKGVDFHYFFTRKVMLSFAAEAYVYFPGGFGTLDEFFEIITLVHTHKISPVPIVLFGREYWNPLLDFLRTTVLDQHQAISESDFDLVKVTDDIDEVVAIAKAAPLRSE